MSENFDHILLFKTNVNCQEDKFFLHAVLDGNPHIEQWSIDLEDVDRVLRVISYTLTHQQVTRLIDKQGYSCIEF